MSNSNNTHPLPTDLPAPIDDGACKHLVGMKLPFISLQSTKGNFVDLSKQKEITIIYCYPRMGTPDKAPPKEWDLIPGARGCTPESCAFRDHYAAFNKFNATIYGLSTQDTRYQKEAVDRLHLPFEILSDEQLQLTKALNLPTFKFEDTVLIKRLTLLVKDELIKKVFYPVFPPDKHPEEILKWLSENYLNSKNYHE